MRDKLIHHKVLSLLAIEIIAGVLTSLGTALLFLKILSEVFETDTQIFDYQILTFIYSLRSPELTKVMIFITNLGAKYMIIISILLTILWIWEKHRREALTFVIILVMGIFINISLKGMIQRPRPTISPLVLETSYSFPSGHAMNSSVFYLAISFYFYHFTRKKRLSLVVTAILILLIILIGFSRVYLGVHYPSDVVGGYVVGTWWLITAILIGKSFNWVKHFKSGEKKAVY